MEENMQQQAESVKKNNEKKLVKRSNNSLTAACRARTGYLTKLNIFVNPTSPKKGPPDYRIRLHLHPLDQIISLTEMTSMPQKINHACIMLHPRAPEFAQASNTADKVTAL
ncbi:hypothetical protein CFP56_012307 [Quercus suber]|uniref:Uncharacterized protein n=1 Tax=Quercus suber TaxID=58331 RepID=A0AAW0M6P2_QUESU